MAERLTTRTPDLELRDSSPARCVVSLDKELYPTIHYSERLTPRTPDLELRDSSSARCVVSLDKELYPTLSLFTQGRVVQSWVKITQG